MRSYFWTSREDRVLRDLYASATVEAVSRRLGRSVAAVHTRARRLCLPLKIRRGKVFKIPNTLLCAYTAGLLDGEGSIQINHSRHRRDRYWRLAVQISSSAPGFLEALWRAWDRVGTISYWQPRGGDRHRRAGSWRVYSGQVEPFLRALLPYLRLKKEHARVALAFRRCVVYSRGRLTSALSCRRTGLAHKMLRLNAKTAKARPGSWRGVR